MGKVKIRKEGKIVEFDLKIEDEAKILAIQELTQAINYGNKNG